MPRRRGRGQARRATRPAEDGGNGRRAGRKCPPVVRLAGRKRPNECPGAVLGENIEGFAFRFFSTATLLNAGMFHVKHSWKAKKSGFSHCRGRFRRSRTAAYNKCSGRGQAWRVAYRTAAKYLNLSCPCRSSRFPKHLVKHPPPLTPPRKGEGDQLVRHGRWSTDQTGRFAASPGRASPGRRVWFVATATSAWRKLNAGMFHVKHFGCNSPPMPARSRLS